ncbi:MAG: hypothetical protein FWH08_04930 [Oscillospiraceae bacterium]|nr:hypothetical protein [Oscillospiraceae bacterium]
MNPCQMNALIAALTNYLYCTLSKKDFIFWNVFFSELSKSMFSMEILREICFFKEEFGPHGHGHGHGHKHEHEHEKAGEDAPDPSDFPEK